MPDQMCYNMPAEIRMAQGCFVFSQRDRAQINNLALVGRQPCIIIRGRKSCNLVSATDGSVDSAGLFAYKGVRAMAEVGDVEIYTWYARMMGAFAAMPEEQKLSLLQWEREHLDRRITDTSDWPGWMQYLGRRPAPGVSKPKSSKEPIPANIRWAVWERDDFTCQRCGARRHLSVDHIIPESKGGALTMDNLQTLCKRCNSQKGSRHD